MATPGASALLGALGALFLAGSIACAQETAGSQEAQSRVLYRKGLAHYNLGEYDQAVDALKEGYRLSAAPGFLFNIAQAYRMKGDCAQARRFYEEDARLEPAAVYHAEVEERIDQMNRCIEQRSADKRLPTSERATAGRGMRIAGLVSAGLGIALLGAGAYFALDARSKSDQVTALTMSDGVWDPALDAGGTGSADKALVFLSAGGAAIVAGSILYFLGWRDARVAARVSAAVTSHGIGLSWHGAF